MAESTAVAQVSRKHDKLMSDVEACARRLGNLVQDIEHHQRTTRIGRRLAREHVRDALARLDDDYVGGAGSDAKSNGIGSGGGGSAHNLHDLSPAQRNRQLSQHQHHHHHGHQRSIDRLSDLKA
jgi:hypothetical protein